MPINMRVMEGILPQKDIRTSSYSKIHRCSFAKLSSGPHKNRARHKRNRYSPSKSAAGAVPGFIIAVHPVIWPQNRPMLPVAGRFLIGSHTDKGFSPTCLQQCAAVKLLHSVDSCPSQSPPAISFHYDMFASQNRRISAKIWHISELYCNQSQPSVV